MFYNKYQDIELHAAGDAIQLKVVESSGSMSGRNTTNVYRLYGGAGADLLAGITISLDPAQNSYRYKGLTFVFKYEANFTYTGGNKINVYGKDLIAVEATKELWITCVWNGSSWDVDVEYDMSNDACVTLVKLNSDIYASTPDTVTGTNDTKLITPKKLADWWADVKTKIQTFAQVVTFTLAPKISAIASQMLTVNVSNEVTGVDLLETRSAEVSFETDEQGVVYIYIPYTYNLVSWKASVTHKVENTNDGTIVLASDGAVVTAEDTITCVAGDAVGTQYAKTPTLSMNAAAGFLSFTTSKATAGGRVHIDIVIKRILD